MQICQVASEVTPFAKTGGLGDVVAGLSRALGRHGHDVRIFLPLYAPIAEQKRSLHSVEFLRDVPLAMGRHELSFSVFTAPLPESPVSVYLVHCPALYHHAGIYSGDWDEYLRFAFLSRAAIESCQRMGWSPHVFHCHDWHTALVPLYLRTVYAWDRLFARTKTLLTLHNLGYHGIFPAAILDDLGLAPHAHLLYNEDLAAGQVSFLKTGLLYADLLTTVSRTYAQEIQTAEHGFGLESLLAARADHLVGIVNGIDYGEWDPATDPHIPHHYSANDLTGKAKMKKTLLVETGLPAGARTPVLGVVSRLTGQKGIELLFDVLPDLFARRDVRIVALGSGEPRYEEFLHWLHHAYPGKAWYYRGYQERLAHWIEAGADLFLMPSRYEPCGLNQMYSLKYGTPPVVRRTGGLADTVDLYDWRSGRGTGFVFEHFTPEGLGWAIDYALSTYEDHAAWERLMRAGMRKNFSWEVQGKKYLDLYRRLAAQ